MYTLVVVLFPTKIKLVPGAKRWITSLFSPSLSQRCEVVNEVSHVAETPANPLIKTSPSDRGWIIRALMPFRDGGGSGWGERREG